MFDVLTEAGASPGLPNGHWLKKVVGLGSPPIANQWADPNFVIPGFRILSPNEAPQAGDVVSALGSINQRTGQRGAGHVEIMVSPTQTVGAGEFNVHFTAWGNDVNALRTNGNVGNYVYRRYVGIDYFK